MNRFASRKGSALLIVLGLLAIMIASAVGFAAYMRFSRLPSSYLRRTSASRQLIKAALARAIDELDTSIANDPHPGIGGRANNKWSHRVFMGNGTNTTGSANITPLCLEALAYVPPPLVDPLRYYSLQSPTATWQEFGFDSGRYTWCALDVSDYFDVNRLVADAPRSSAANRRVSLSYIFEDVNHGKAGSGPTAWDKFMEEFRGSPDKNTGNFDFKNQTPLVSVADLNLALGRKGAVGNFFSPFCDYLNGDRTSFSTTGDRAGDEYLSRMTFVTDGLFPAVSGETVNSKGETVYDLNDGRYQPFAGEDLDNDGGQSPSPARILFEGAGMQDRTVWASRITGLGCAALFDYLDTDRVPVSLAIPTLERTPMICGVHAQIPGSAKLSLLKSLKYEDDDTKSGYSGVTAAGDGTVRTVQQVVTYKINEFASAFMGGEITTLVSFPFARNYDSDGDRSYSIDGKMSYFFSTENMPLRTGEGTALHIQTKELQGLMNTDIGQGLMSVALPETKTTVNTAGKNGDPASHIQRIPLTLAEGVAFGPLLAQDQYAFATITYVWQQTGRKNRFDGGASMTWSPSFEDAKKSGAAAIAAATSGLKFYRANGTAIANNDLVNVIKGGNTVVNLNAAVWLRVKDGDGNVVDMVPADPKDDTVQNEANWMMRDLAYVGQVGAYGPLMRFDTGVQITMSAAGLDELVDQGKQIKFDPLGAMIADPRFNYAPEQWFRYDGNSIDGNTWLAEVQPTLSAGDGDMFMATSDAGYMQSVYELAHLPRLNNFGSVADPLCGDLSTCSANGQHVFAQKGSEKNRGYMCRTYEPFGDDYDAFEQFPRTSEGNGFKINPYSDSTNVVMAVFANTPMDWAHASTNIVEGEEYDRNQKASDFNSKYAFNEYSSAGKIEWNDLAAIAGNYINRVRSNGGNWKTAWADMDWYGDENKFCDVALSGNTDTLWMADRKFLYGYWRDCFAPRQQLFLIFVRAEPTMMGGEGAGQIPPQLGARAVALVWRDPTASRDDRTPHQTRVLFYRQFD